MKTSPTDSFRPDIEGMRAIAVLLVVAAHAHVPGLQGGFIGVDIFFVISGYLITRLLKAEWDSSGRIDIPAFYARRMRRLLPAFALMLVFVIGAIWVVYAPIEQPQMLASAFAATLYFSNVHYALEATNYMAPLAKLDPLLHTWSLGVEEQFYLVWPLLLLGAGHLTRMNQGRQRPFALLLGSIMLLSFLASIYLTTTRQPLAFFLPVTRAWEFGAGAVVALYAERMLVPGQWLGRLLARKYCTEMLTLGALALIAGAATGLSGKSAFPGWLALLPVAGTTLLLLLIPAAPGGSLAGRLLALAPLQWLGKLSYGWYLWHWPMLVIGRVLLPAPGLATDLALVAVALVTAQVSHTLIERPVREGMPFQRKTPNFAMALVVAVTCVLLIQKTGSAAMTEAGSERFKRLMAARSDVPALYRANCDGWFYNASLMECQAGAADGQQTAILLGDSHAGQWFTAVHEIMRSRGWKLVVMTKSACPIIDKDFFYARIGRMFTECGVWKQAAVRRIQEIRPALVIISNSENYSFSDADWASGIQRILTPIADASGQLVIVRDTPNPGFSSPECLARQEWNPTLSWRPCSFDASRSLSPAVLKAYQSVAATRPNIHIVDMSSLICAETPCQVRLGDLIKYRDANHLSDTFVRTLTIPLADALFQAGAL